MLRKPGEKKPRMQRVSVLLKWKPRGVLAQRAREGGQLLWYQEGHHATASFSVILEKSHELGEGEGGGPQRQPSLGTTKLTISTRIC